MDFSIGDSSVLISVFLFLVTMVIMFIMRMSDKKNFRLPTIKKMAEKYESEMDRSCQSFRQEAMDTEDKISKKIVEVNNLVNSVNSQIKDISSYSDDMAKLRSAMKTFHEALDGLARLSANADEKVAEVTQDTERLESVRNEIEQFRREMQEADERLSSHEQRVIELERSSMDKVELAVNNVSSQLEDAILTITKKHNETIENANEEIERISNQKISFVETSLESTRASVEKNLYNFEDRLETFKKVSEILSSGGKEILSNICERSSEMLLASETVESLVQQRDKLEKQIADLSELKRLEEDNIAIARKEYDRLTSSVNNTPKENDIKIQNFEVPVFSTPDIPKTEEKQEEPVIKPVDYSRTPETKDEYKEYYGKEEVVTFDN